MAQNGTENTNENGIDNADETGTDDANGNVLDDGTQALTNKQLDALPYLISSPNLSEGARLADIGRTTLYRWMHDAEFRETLQHLRAQAAEIAHAELSGLMLKAAVVLSDAMEDPSPSIRLRAARSTMHIGLKAVDLKDMQTRLDIIDDALDNLQSEKSQS